jgi:hypothetical protein
MLNESITSLLSHVAHWDFRKEYLMRFLKVRERNNQINTLSLFAKLAKLLCPISDAQSIFSFQFTFEG